MSSTTLQETTDTAIADPEKAQQRPSEPDTDPVSAKDHQYEVTLEPEDDPQQLPLALRWLTVFTISTASLCVTSASSAAAETELAVAEKFGVSKEVGILGVSLFVLGLGLGPLITGPLSELYGRNIVYRVSFFLFFAFTFPVAFAPSLAVFFVFRFVTGFCGSSFLSVAGGSVTDLFPNHQVATPMALYTISPFLGPIIGPIYGGFVNQNTTWRWTYWVLIIWSFAQLVAILLIVPETYIPVLLKWKAQRLRKVTGDVSYYAPIEKHDHSLASMIIVSCYKPFQLVIFDRMALLIDLWQVPFFTNSLLLGILYLTFQAFPIVFEKGHGFNQQMTGLTFLGIGLGLLIGLATTPYWNSRFSLYEKRHGSTPPEFRLKQGQLGGVLVAISLFCVAFTTYPHVHWIVPIIASIPFGTGMYCSFVSSFTYLVIAYRPIAASAMAANTAMRTVFAAAFPLFAPAMYHRLGTVGATALLAGLTTVMAPLPFVFYKIGARLRAQSRFAAH
ncbi:MFS general substrate transporter [Auriscalpium vulgare]|uniref:MFS general substrate transporter n=1 Tax=Auriscalpium vulgare TaxID=40419 RepID=A0ACB8RV70_9AGAM|nr:MFS general substrate transporter [Auriscalpium vulgare]